MGGDVQMIYRAPGQRLNMTNEQIYFINLAWRYKVLDGRGTINLRFNDILRSNIYKSMRYSNEFTEQLEWQGQTRNVVVSFQYTFQQGKLKKRASKRADHEDGALE